MYPPPPPIIPPRLVEPFVLLFVAALLSRVLAVPELVIARFCFLLHTTDQNSLVGEDDSHCGASFERSWKLGERESFGFRGWCPPEAFTICHEVVIARLVSAWWRYFEMSGSRFSSMALFERGSVS